MIAVGRVVTLEEEAVAKLLLDPADDELTSALKRVDAISAQTIGGRIHEDKITLQEIRNHLISWYTHWHTEAVVMYKRIGHRVNTVSDFAKAPRPL